MDFNITTNKYGRKCIEATEDGKYRGSAELAWIKNDGCNAPHWASIESVPLMPTRWNYISGKYTAEEALEKAVKGLEYSISIGCICG